MALTRATLSLPTELVEGMVNTVTGESALAQLSASRPIAFDGETEFVFNLDNEIAIVAEGARKPSQDGSISSKTITPLKVVYTLRASDEFMTADDEHQLGTLEAFGEGLGRKIAKGFDLMAIHGINPFDDSESAVIGTNCFDRLDGINNVTAGTDIDETVELAIEAVTGSEYDVSGVIISPAARKELAALTNNNGDKKYPQLAWGAKVAAVNGLPLQVTSNLSHKASGATTVDKLLCGDFQNYFRWGYAREIGIEIIEYGDPDNTGVDLKGANQIALRGEAYLGWAIFEPAAFALHSVTSA